MAIGRPPYWDGRQSGSATPTTNDLASNRQGRKERITAFDRRWGGRFIEHLRIAQPAGDLGPEEDIDQVFFEVDAYLLYAHAAFAFRGDPEVLDRASEAVRRRLGWPAVMGRGPTSS